MPDNEQKKFPIFRENIFRKAKVTENVLNFCFQECKFNVGSYIHDASQIEFTGTFGHDVVNQVKIS